MVKVELNTEKYVSCLSCHSKEPSKFNFLYKIAIGLDAGRNVINLCDECLHQVVIQAFDVSTIEWEKMSNEN